MEPDPVWFRRVLSHFCTGVVVMTATTATGPDGLTCQSFSALSLDPPLVVAAVARSSSTWLRVRAVGSFAVNVLGEGQEELSRQFAGAGGDRFAGVSWRAGQTGAPLLAGALAHIECELVALHDGGDHDLVVASVVALSEHAVEARPLLYFRSEYRRLHD